MKYSLKQIQVFDAIASEESVSAAAKKLSLSQSAVSMSLAQLENLLDRPLFIRQGNRMMLSHWGNWLKPRAKRLLLDAQEIQLGLYEQHILSGCLSICASQTVAEYLIPDLIGQLDHDFPELRISLEVKSSDRVIEKIINYDAELGVIEGHCDDSRITTEPWLDDHLVVICSRHHAFSHAESLSFNQLQQAKWVLREKGAGTREIFDGAFHCHGEKLNVWKEYEQVNVLKHLVQHGSYLSALPYLDVEKELQSGDLIALPTPDLDMHRKLSFIWRTDSGACPLRDGILSQARRLARIRQSNRIKIENKGRNK